MWSILSNADRYSKSSRARSYSLDLVGDHHGVLLPDLGGGLGSVVVRAAVLVRVTVNPTENVPTAAVKTWNAGQEKVSDADSACLFRPAPSQK